MVWNKRTAGRAIVEKVAETVFSLCALTTVLATVLLALYMIANGVPAVFRAGIRELLFSPVWEPVAAKPSYGLLYMILASAVGTGLAALLGVPVGLLTAVFLAELAPDWLAALVRPAVELLAGIPSVVYGLLGLKILNPLLYRWELTLFADSQTHQFTGGANLLSGALVLAVMILPTVISVSERALRSVPPELRASSFALGASRIQMVFGVMVPAAGQGIVTAVVLGVGRAMGEAAAVSLVAGNGVNLPLPFSSVRFLTTAIVSEMGYAGGLHRQVLFTMGLLLFLFVMGSNMLLNGILRRGENPGA